MKNVILILTFFLSLSAFADENPFWTITKNDKGMTVKIAKIDVVSRSSDGAWEIKTQSGTSLTLDKSGKLVSVKGTEVKTAQRDLKLTLPGGKQAIIPKGRILTFIDGYLRSVK